MSRWKLKREGPSKKCAKIIDTEHSATGPQAGQALAAVFAEAAGSFFKLNLRHQRMKILQCRGRSG